MFKEFREFVARGNVIDLAVGVIMGAAFGRIVTTLVEGVLMPPLGLLLGNLDFSSMLYVLDRSAGVVPTSLADAKAKGIPVLAYGQFINDVIGFVIVALAVFVLVKQVNRIKRLGEVLIPDLEHPAPPPSTKECPFCTSTIPVRAKRCPLCTSQLS
jgi:large conductance mechanosensitive channel